MSFGLEKSEIESIFIKAVERERKRYLAGGRLENKIAEHISLAVSEAIVQNNTKILEALTKAGVNLAG